jgi:hypothetical protein
MSRRLRSVVAGLAVSGALAGAAIAHAAGSTTTTPSAPSASPATGYHSMPAATNHKGNCPNMGGGSSGSGSSSGSSASPESSL